MIFCMSENRKCFFACQKKKLFPFLTCKKNCFFSEPQSFLSLVFKLLVVAKAKNISEDCMDRVLSLFSICISCHSDKYRANYTDNTDIIVLALN